MQNTGLEGVLVLKAHTRIFPGVVVLKVISVRAPLSYIAITLRFSRRKSISIWRFQILPSDANVCIVRRRLGPDS